ncbi:hypothetical protein L6452_00687 [Arctium lappa]|uniref:Uncharacterized protein n=1 Tax=Arctium lappa TaxID=4217 RepID=A0ACB9FFK2_ARCLA|nr:hypothetical protein L6452_00687 [Arctium lappa]
MRLNIQNKRKSRKVADESMFGEGNGAEFPDIVDQHTIRQGFSNGLSVIYSIVRAPLLLLSCLSSHPHISGAADGVWVSGELARISEVNHLMVNDSMRYAILILKIGDLGTCEKGRGCYGRLGEEEGLVEEDVAVEIGHYGSDESSSIVSLERNTLSAMLKKSGPKTRVKTVTFQDFFTFPNNRQPERNHFSIWVFLNSSTLFFFWLPIGIYFTNL